MSDQWANRIVGHGDEDPEQLLANPNNWRIHPKHQQEALSGALDDIGYIAPATVNKRTGHLVDGHLRVQLAMRKGQTSIPVIYVDLDETEEKQALASLDPISSMAERDNKMLVGLLNEIAEEGAMLHGFTEDELALMELSAYGDDDSMTSNLKAGSNAEQDTVTLTFIIDPAHKETITEKLNGIREESGDISLGEALYVLCKETL